MKNLSVVLSTLLASTLLANDTLDTYFQMSIQELLQVEVEGSTKTRKDLLHTPASVTVFTHKEIKRLGASTLNELMNYVSGFQSRRTGNNPIVYATTTRGHTSGQSSRDILVLIDGQRVNSDWNAGPGIQYTLIPLENVKKIEFIKGAGSSLYGSNAFSAVINIETLNDTNEVTARFSDHSMLGSALVSTKTDELSFSGFIKGVGDSGMNYYNVEDTVNGGVANTQDPYNSIDLYLQTHYKDLSFYVSHAAKSNEDFYTLRYLSDDNERDIDQTHLRATFDFSLFDTIDSQFALSYLQNRDEIYAEVVPGLYGNTIVQEKTPSAEWFNSYNINTTSSIQFGAEYRHPKITEATVVFSNAPTTVLPVGEESAREIYGIYAQYQVDPLQDVQITVGARYDYYSDFGSSFNPRAAVLYSLMSDTVVKLLYSRAFRAPSRNELDVTNNGALEGNPNLDPEIINSYEAILMKQYEKHTVSLSYYINDISNIIIDVAEPAPSTAIIRQNADDGIYRGVELEYVGEAMKDLQVRASYSHLFSKPDFAFRSSDDIISTVMNYKWNDFLINLSGYLHSSTDNDDGGTLEKVPSYTLVDTKLTYQIQKNTSLFFQMKNIFDKDYSTPSEGSTNTINVPNRGQEIFAGLEITF
jgi:outer membrane cobalamin receptor